MGPQEAYRSWRTLNRIMLVPLCGPLLPLTIWIHLNGEKVEYQVTSFSIAIDGERG